MEIFTPPPTIDTTEGTDSPVGDFSPSPGSEFESALAEAMQDVWNDHCADTGCFPTCFELHGPRTSRLAADFHGSHFVSEIVKLLRHRGYIPNTETSREAGK
jgi:hypothetical protein